MASERLALKALTRCAIETGRIMAIFVGLLRAINVGGTGMLPMKELSALCEGLGFQKVRTYIQSGNVALESSLSEENVKAKLEHGLAKKMGRKIDVLVRSAPELRSVLEANPFPDAPPAKVAVVFLPGPTPKALLENLATPGGEEVRRGNREIYIFYPDGMGRSKLRLPAVAGAGTARNINTVVKLVAMTVA
jgi:uncharacterized protein (DUF1697 family)